jgi:hypothetical protein
MDFDELWLSREEYYMLFKLPFFTVVFIRPPRQANTIITVPRDETEAKQKQYINITTE